MFIVRHGESQFNHAFKKSRRDPGIIDPELTTLGIQQIKNTAHFFYNKSIGTCISSPYRRAIQTTMELFDLKNTKLVISHLVGEQFGFSCDIGSSRSQLEQKWPLIDFADLRENWWPHEPESRHDVKQRAAEFFKQYSTLFDTADDLVIVSHWGFIKSLTGLSVENGTVVEYFPDGSNSVVYKPAI